MNGDHQKKLLYWDGNDEKDIAMRVSFVTIAGNLILSLFKLAAGIFSNSGAMVSDAVHSASDVLSSFVVVIGVKLSGKEPDREHPYGHDRLECVASVVLAVILAATGIGIGMSGFKKIVSTDMNAPVVPGMPALLAAIVSIVAKEWMYWYTRGAARRIGSGALMADAWHHRSDALSSVGALAGIFFARIGFPVMDPVAGIVICVFIEKAALDIFKDALDKMVDKSCPDAVVFRMREIILSQPGVEGIDEIKTRLFGSKVYVDVEILASGDITLTEAHTIAESVHDAIERECGNVKHCMVHVNPLATGEK